jgi:pimeloyl-ACP methyl ester carboxylesterase
LTSLTWLRYWDLSFANYNYSYVDAATKAGYCTLSYDRLGIGNSSHGEPRDEIQINLEIEALHQLTMMLQNGSYPGVNQTFGKTIHVGHSFGSAQTYALVNLYPNISDGAVLTGFSMNSSFVPSFAAGGNFRQANTNAPIRFGNTSARQIQQLIAESPLADYLTGIDLSDIPNGQGLPNGYLVSNNAEAIQLQFFQPGYFDPAVLTLSDQTKQPVTIGELLTLGSLATMNNYAGPVMVINGEGDVPYCGGNCSATGIPNLPSLAAAVKMSFPNVDTSNFTAYIQPNTAHGINLHYNATAAYDQIIQFLASKGLNSS